jgi:hypothetical protein
LSAGARFYFLSNEELLDILSQVKNPAAVQPHLQKCFDGIRRLEMRQEEHGLEVAAMISAEGARLGLVKPVKVRSGCRSRWGSSCGSWSSQCSAHETVAAVNRRNIALLVKYMGRMLTCAY